MRIAFFFLFFFCQNSFGASFTAKLLPSSTLKMVWGSKSTLKFKLQNLSNKPVVLDIQSTCPCLQINREIALAVGESKLIIGTLHTRSRSVGKVNVAVVFKGSETIEVPVNGEVYSFYHLSRAYHLLKGKDGLFRLSIPVSTVKADEVQSISNVFSKNKSLKVTYTQGFLHLIYDGKEGSHIGTVIIKNKRKDIPDVEMSVSTTSYLYLDLPSILKKGKANKFFVRGRKDFPFMITKAKASEGLKFKYLRINSYTYQVNCISSGNMTIDGIDFTIETSNPLFKQKTFKLKFK